jgi:hypothetical protein
VANADGLICGLRQIQLLRFVMVDPDSHGSGYLSELPSFQLPTGSNAKIGAEWREQDEARNATRNAKRYIDDHAPLMNSSVPALETYSTAPPDRARFWSCWPRRPCSIRASVVLGMERYPRQQYAQAKAKG